MYSIIPNVCCTITGTKGVVMYCLIVTTGKDVDTGAVLPANQDLRSHQVHTSTY